MRLPGSCAPVEQLPTPIHGFAGAIIKAISPSSTHGPKVWRHAGSLPPPAQCCCQHPPRQVDVPGPSQSRWISLCRALRHHGKGATPCFRRSRLRSNPGSSELKASYDRASPSRLAHSPLTCHMWKSCLTRRTWEARRTELARNCYTSMKGNGEHSGLQNPLTPRQGLVR